MNDDETSAILTDPRNPIADGLGILETIHSLKGTDSFEGIVDELLERNRDDRFAEAANIVRSHFDVEDSCGINRDAVYSLLERLCINAQQSLLLRALQVEKTDDHMALIGILEAVRTSIDADTAPARHSGVALAARLYRYANTDTEDTTLPDTLLEEAALCEYQTYESIGEPLDRHPDTVPPVFIHADMRVYGGVLAYNRYSLSIEQGARLSGESVESFKETVDSYTEADSE